MHSPQWFLAGVVRPTVEEFDGNRTSMRHGMLAALVVSSLADHICVASCPPDIDDEALRAELRRFRKALREESLAFALVQDLADVTKHKRLDRKSAYFRDMSGIRLKLVPLVTSGGAAIVTNAGQRLGVSQQVAVVKDGVEWPLRDQVLEALALLEGKLSG